MKEEPLKTRSPLYMVGRKDNCWQCKSRMSVLALLAPHVEHTDNEICVLSNVDTLPADILKYLQERVPYFKKKYSQTAGCQYYVNTCPKCGILYGDFYLHGEPESLFFSVDEKDAQSL